ncbi:tripartite tricarboxylate transporter substrate binding protein [Shinella sp.]
MFEHVKNGTAALALMAALAMPTVANADWPSDKPIELLVGFAPGGGQDIMARTMQPFLEKHLGAGAKVIVVNKPGGGAELAYTALAQAKPDGYTFSLMSLPGFLTMQVSREVGFKNEDIVPLARLVVDPSFVVVSANSEFKTLKDVVETAKSSDTPVTMGGSGVGTDEHFTALALKNDYGVNIVYAPFNSNAEAITAAMGGHIAMSGSSLSSGAGDLTGGGQLRPIAILQEERHADQPDVPTAKEQGFDIVFSSERGIASNANVSEEIRTRMSSAIKATLDDPEFRAAAAPLNIPFAYLDGPDWALWLKDRDAVYRTMWEKSPWQ